MTHADLDPSLPTALFGGTFDPVHRGHVAIARAALAHSPVRQVVVLPAAVPPHKMGHAIATATDRLAMLELAFGEQAHCCVSDAELTRPGPSYTVDTAAHFRRHCHNRLWLLLGMDSLRELHLWHEARRLIAMCEVLVYRRPGNPLPTHDDLGRYFGDTAAGRLRAAVLDGPDLPISSSAVRGRVAAGKQVTHLLPFGVAEYIETHRLYR